MSAVMPFYREAGTGFPMLCLHASAGGPGQWRALMARLTRAIPYVEARELDGVGHMGPVTHPERVNAATASFLGRVLGVGPRYSTSPVGRAA